MQQENSQASVSGAMVTCVECGNSFPQGEVIQFGGYSVCANCKPAFQQKLAEGSFRPGSMRYASVRRRSAALLLDSVILWFTMSISFLAVFSLFRAHANEPRVLITLYAIWYFISFAATLTYMIFFTGRFGGTPGKMALKIKIVRADGSAVSYPLAAGRYFATFVSSITLFIGYFIAIFDKEKRTLHDRICGTRVVRA